MRDEPGPPMSPGVRANCARTEPPVDTPDSARIAAELESSLLGLVELFDGYLYPAGEVRGLDLMLPV